MNYELRTAEDYLIRKIEALESCLARSKDRTKQLEEAIGEHRQVSERHSDRSFMPDNNFYAIHGWDRDLWALLRDRPPR